MGLPEKNQGEAQPLLPKCYLETPLPLRGSVSPGPAPAYPAASALVGGSSPRCTAGGRRTPQNPLRAYIAQPAPCQATLALAPNSASFPAGL